MLVGAMLDAGGITRDFDANGTGSATGFSVGLYATYLHRAGWYADLVAKADFYKNKFTALADQGATTARGTYNTAAYGLSLELGRMFVRRDGTMAGWWVEPNLQVANVWLKGTTYDTTPAAQQINVKLDNGTAQQYRAQVRFGKQIANGRWYPYAKFAAVKVESQNAIVHADDYDLRAQSIYDGIRAEFGLGTTYLINAKSQLYLDYEYARAALYERPWTLNLGYRRVW